MALGRQFENTYWEDPETGETKSWTREKDPAGVPRVSPTKRINASDDELSGHQGLLFHPATATGTKDDPLVPLERRETAANVALGLTDIDAYKKRVLRGSNVKISDNMARADAELLRNSLVNSMTPIREIENTKTSAYLNPRRDRGGGFAEEYTDTIMIGKQKINRLETIPEHTVKETKPTSTPIHNPKFWDWHDKTTAAAELTSNDIIHRMNTSGDVHWHNPETGESLNSEEANLHTEWEGTPVYGPRDPRVRAVDAYGSHFTRYNAATHGPLQDIDPEDVEIERGWIPREEGLEKLREKGFVPNIFPGAGKSTAKTHANPSFTVERDYANYRGQYPTARVHTRFVPGDVTERVIPEQQKWVKTPYISQGTLIHEIGHQRDYRMGDPYSHRKRLTKNIDRYAFADPLEEGFADGRRDRYATTPHGGMGDMYEDVLHDPSDFTKSMKKGYGVDHPQWKNKTHKALYAASRITARTGGKGRDQFPSRQEIANSLGIPLNDSRSQVRDHENYEHAETVNTMALGHMLTTNPRLMKHLEGQGLGDTGRKARSAYISAYRERRSSDAVQDRLPGFD